MAARGRSRSLLVAGTCLVWCAALPVPLVFAAWCQDAAPEVIPAGAAPCARHWLRDGQAPDGTWGRRTGPVEDHPVGVTSLVTFSMLCSGITSEVGRSSAHVGRALAWLSQSQDPDSGRIGPPECDDLEHVLATLALCEDAGRTSDAERRRQTRRALTHLVSLQDEQGRWHSRFTPYASAWAALTLATAGRYGLADPGDSAGRARLALETDIDAALRDPQSGSPTHVLPVVAALLLLDPDWGQTPDGVRVLAALPDPSAIQVRPTAAVPLRLEEVFWATCAYRRVGGPAWNAWDRRLPTFLEGAVTSVPARGPGAWEAWDPEVTPGPFGTCEDAGSLAALVQVIFYRYDCVIAEGP